MCLSFEDFCAMFHKLTTIIFNDSFWGLPRANWGISAELQNTTRLSHIWYSSVLPSYVSI